MNYVSVSICIAPRFHLQNNCPQVDDICVWNDLTDSHNLVLFDTKIPFPKQCYGRNK